MVTFLNTALILAGAGLMMYNICGFARFARSTRAHRAFAQGAAVLYVPVGLLVFFLLGYLFVGIFGHPDLMTAGILFGGSVFVFIMYRLLKGITHRIMEAETLEKKLLVAEETSRAKNSFMASVSHEMRTPLNVILGLDGLALRSENLSSETRSYLERIGVSANHLLGLIGNVLDMNRISSGTLTVRQEEFSLVDTMKETLAMAEVLCRTKGLTFTSDMPQPEPGHFVGDEALLRQALFSMLDNAAKYTDPPGEVRFTLTVTPEAPGRRRLSLAVSDTGIGISPEYLPHVFDPFSQEDSSFTNRFGGSGLGMAVTKNLVELMGGSIQAESEKGVGTTFTVMLTLPFVPAPEAGPEEASPLASLEGCRVLVVEDLPDNAEIVQDQLSLEGVETDHAVNGQLALEMFGASEPFHYDAILMDLRMPVMDGLEATRRIRALEREDAPIVPIIALTANAFPVDVEQSLAAGMDLHLAKPSDADALYDALRRQIAQSRKRRGAL